MAPDFMKLYEGISDEKKYINYVHFFPPSGPYCVMSHMSSGRLNKLLKESTQT